MRKVLELFRYTGWLVALIVARIFGAPVPANTYIDSSGQVYHNPGVAFNWHNAFIAGMVTLFLVELIRALILKAKYDESIYSNLG